MSLAGIAFYVYTVLLKPAPLRWLANKILLAIIPKSVRIEEGILYVHPHDPVISGALALRVYEPYQLDLFRSYLKEGMVVLDIGANIGLYTLIASKRVGETGKVISFEPEPENFSILSKNIKENEMWDNTTSVQKAAADKEGTFPLFLAESNKGNHSIYAHDDSIKTIPVETVSVDIWLSENGIEKVDIIKIDIQGAEPLAFSGMKNILKSNPILLVEYEPILIRSAGYDPIGMLDLLKTSGYNLFNIDENKKSIRQIEDIQIFTTGLPRNAYANILGLKRH